MRFGKNVDPQILLGERALLETLNLQRNVNIISIPTNVTQTVLKPGFNILTKASLAYYCTIVPRLMQFNFSFPLVVSLANFCLYEVFHQLDPGP